MSHLWTPNQTPKPCRCVKYNPAPEPEKCGTCGRPYGVWRHVPDLSEAVHHRILRGGPYAQIRA